MTARVVAVLDAHADYTWSVYYGSWCCACGERFDAHAVPREAHRAHVAEALAQAGIGVLADVETEAFARGAAWAGGDDITTEARAEGAQAVLDAVEVAHRRMHEGSTLRAYDDELLRVARAAAARAATGGES